MEPVRKSVYDVLNHNLKLAGRTTFIHRYIYLGEHRGEKEIEDAFTVVVKTINDSYCAEKLTGLLVIYPNYFFHIIDGAESVLGRHLIFLFTEFDHLFGEVKIISVYHHINQIGKYHFAVRIVNFWQILEITAITAKRFFDEWGVRRAKPPILLEKIDPACDFEELKRYLWICLTKVYNLGIELRKVDPEKEEPTTIGEIQPYMNQYLPEYKLVQYILNEKDIFPVRLALKYEDMVLDTKYSLDYVWPIRNDYVPYNVFDVDKYPIPNLPNAK